MKQIVILLSLSLAPLCGVIAWQAGWLTGLTQLWQILLFAWPASIVVFWVVFSRLFDVAIEPRARTVSWSALSKFFHWFMALCMFGAAALMYYMVNIGNLEDPVLRAEYSFLMKQHKSIGLIVLFLVLHTVGSHYTYVRVPYDEVVRALLGLEINRSFGWLRNHYDRLVHFAYGLLLAYPFFELLERYAEPATGWSYFLSPALIMATSMIFEVLEWWATEILGDGAGAAYLGSQGDEWDAQKDMALAALGSIITMGVLGVIL